MVIKLSFKEPVCTWIYKRKLYSVQCTVYTMYVNGQLKKMSLQIAQKQICNNLLCSIKYLKEFSYLFSIYVKHFISIFVCFVYLVVWGERTGEENRRFLPASFLPGGKGGRRGEQMVQLVQVHGPRTQVFPLVGTRARERQHMFTLSDGLDKLIVTDPGLVSSEKILHRNQWTYRNCIGTSGASGTASELVELPELHRN